jgi:hypothetical protein
VTDKEQVIGEVQSDDEVTEKPSRHSRRVLVEFDAETEDDAQDLAMAIWYAAQASRATDFWVLPSFQMRPDDDWSGSGDVEIVVRKRRRR